MSAPHESMRASWDAKCDCLLGSSSDLQGRRQTRLRLFETPRHWIEHTIKYPGRDGAETFYFPEPCMRPRLDPGCWRRVVPIVLCRTVSSVRVQARPTWGSRNERPAWVQGACDGPAGRAWRGRRRHGQEAKAANQRESHTCGAVRSGPVPVPGATPPWPLLENKRLPASVIPGFRRRRSGSKEERRKVCWVAECDVVESRSVGENR